MAQPKKEAPSAVATLAPLTGAALSTAAIMYPVDVIRALKMSSAGSGTKAFSVGDFYKSHGVRGFLSQGVLPELAKSTTMRVSKFFFFPIVCEGMWGVEPAKASPGQKGLAGALATVPEILMIAPMEVAKIGLQIDHTNKFKNDSRAFISHVYQTRGVSGMWSGWAGMQWRQSWWTGLYFASLGSFKNVVEPSITKAGGPPAVASLVSGFCAGVFASIPNAPGDVVRSVVQRRMFEDPSRPAYGVGVGSILEHVRMTREIIAARGVGALYAGFTFKALHMGGSGALMAMLVPIFSNAMGIGYSGV